MHISIVTLFVIFWGTKINFLFLFFLGQNVMEGIHRKSYSEAVIEGVRKRARVFVGDSIVRKTNRVLNKGDDVVVCLPGAKIEAITERVENIVGSGKGGS